MNSHLEKPIKKQARLLSLIFIAILGFWQNACGPEPRPETPSGRSFALDYNGALDLFTKIQKALAANDAVQAQQFIHAFQDALPKAFPMEIPKPFLPHTFQDLLMKDTRMIKGLNLPDVSKSWNTLLMGLAGRRFYHGHVQISIDTQIAQLVLQGVEPKLSFKLFSSFPTLSIDEDRKINNVFMESFWQGHSLYPSARQRTGVVLVKDENNIIAMLQFNNQLVSKKAIDLTSQYDLSSVVSSTPGYVSAVGRLAAYARFGIGEKMFDNFFKYARANGLEGSYLHVRKDNPSAIHLYETLGYQIVGEIPNFYRDPPSNAYVMLKKFGPI